jgi:predicted ATPase/DNA-binding SARP family transcriptional activator
VIVSESISTPLTITLFGPMRVLVEGHPLPRLRSRKALWLLALLALRAGRPVEREWLAGTLWPDIDQGRAATNLRVVLSELRRALGSEGGRLQSPGRHTLLLDLVGADVDLCKFDTAMVSRDQEVLKEAVALYQGPLLEGCSEEWVPQERNVREQECLQALLMLADAAIASGDAETAIFYYRRAVSLDPWREVTQRGLMQALSQAGDGNAAMQTYQAFVRLLQNGDPRAVPDERTTSLYTRLRTEARWRVTAQTSIDAEVVGEPMVTGYLPSPLTDLVGREDERQEVAERLHRSRLVTLTGPGGIGKTRLALAVAAEVAPEFTDGVWLVALEALSAGVQISGQIAGVLGVKEEPGRAALQTVTDRLRDRRLLLVLDNCEHLLQASAEFVAHLLRECAWVRVLATSREALGITGETSWAVPSLSVPDLMHLPTDKAALRRVLLGFEGVRLFVERAQSVQKTFSFSGADARTVAVICARLEGIPLALELAAARVKVLTVGQIAIHLDDYLGLLTGGDRTALPRQQTLRATLDWSYDLLGTAERLLLGRLSVFAGGWDLKAVEEVCMGGAVEAHKALDLLTSLVDKSLVIFDSGRYRLPETVRQYASERLQTSGEAGRVKVEHRSHFLTVAEEAEPHLKGADQDVWLGRLEREHENFRAALAGVAEDAEDALIRLRLVGALKWFWSVRGYYREGRQFLDQALGGVDAQSRTSARARSLSAAGVLAYSESDYGSAQTFFEESLGIFRELGDRPEAARILVAISDIWIERGDYPTAQALLEESLGVFQEFGDRRGIAQALVNLGTILNGRNEYGAARVHYEESLHIFEDLGDKRSTAWLLSYLGINASSQCDYAAAQAYYEQSLPIFEEIGDRKSMAVMINHLGSAAGNQGDYALARLRLEQCVGIYREIGDRRVLAWSLAGLGRVLQEQGEYISARSSAEESLRLFEQVRDRRGCAVARLYLGDMASEAGDLDSAQTYYSESLRLGRELQDKVLVAMNLEGLAVILLDRHRPKLSVKLCGATAVLRENIGVPLSPKERENSDNRVAQARVTLGEEAFGSAWEEGCSLNWEQATACVLAEFENSFTAGEV